MQTTPCARAAWEKSTNSIKSYDYNPSVGGPILRDRLWYFGTFRYWGTDNKLAGIFWDKDTTDFLYTPDLSRQHVWVERIKNVAVRPTWQATAKNKFQFYFQQQPRVGFASEVLNLMPEARSQRDSLGNGNIYSQVLYSSPITSRVLIEGGYSYFLERVDVHEREGTPVTGPNAFWPILEASTGNWYNYPGTIGPIGPARSAFHSLQGVGVVRDRLPCAQGRHDRGEGSAGPDDVISPRHDAAVPGWGPEPDHAAWSHRSSVPGISITCSESMPTINGPGAG